jgi:hypothetical protein
VELTEVASRLYGLDLEDFTGARNASAAQAKSDGQPLLARQVKALAKPSLAAWALNRMARQSPESLAGLSQLGTALQEAQQQLDGAALRSLARDRTALLRSLVDQVGEQAAGHGHPLSGAALTAVEDTLRAALSSPLAAAAVLSGGLVRTLASDDGPAEVSAAVAVPLALEPEAGKDEAVPAAHRPKAKATDPDLINRHRAALADAEQAVQDTSSAEEQARAALSQATEAAGAAAARRAELQERVRTLEEQLFRARHELGMADSDTAQLARACEAAERTMEGAARKSLEARRRLAVLSGDPTTRPVR